MAFQILVKIHFIFTSIKDVKWVPYLNTRLDVRERWSGKCLNEPETSGLKSWLEFQYSVFSPSWVTPAFQETRENLYFWCGLFLSFSVSLIITIAHGDRTIKSWWTPVCSRLSFKVLTIHHCISSSKATTSLWGSSLLLIFKWFFYRCLYQ